MIERIGTTPRASKVVKHNGVVYLSGQVAEGETIEIQVKTCLDKIDALLLEAGSTRKKYFEQQFGFQI